MSIFYKIASSNDRDQHPGVTASYMRQSKHILHKLKLAFKRFTLTLFKASQNRNRKGWCFLDSKICEKTDFNFLVNLLKELPDQALRHRLMSALETLNAYDKSETGASLTQSVEIVQIAGKDVGADSDCTAPVDLNLLLEDVFQTLTLENLPHTAPVKLLSGEPLPPVLIDGKKLKLILLLLSRQALKLSDHIVTLGVARSSMPATFSEANDEIVAARFSINYAIAPEPLPTEHWLQLPGKAGTSGQPESLEPRVNLSVYLAEELLATLNSDLLIERENNQLKYQFDLTLIQYKDGESYSPQLKESQLLGEQSAASAMRVSGIDQEALLKRFNPPVASTVLKLFAQTARLEIWKIENSLAKECLAEVSEEAQSFGKSCRTICAEDLAEVCIDVKKASGLNDAVEVRRLVNQLKAKVEVTLREIRTSCGS